jgi:hypothetical protein
MPYQLTGRTALTSERSTGRAVLFSVLGLSAALGIFAWRQLPHPATPPPAIAPQPEAPTPLAKPAPESVDLAPTEDQRLHLAHAEQALVDAAEQLTTARRLLAALSPDLGRSYLQYEKRRADSAWTACDAATRAIEQARDDIKVVAPSRKD